MAQIDADKTSVFLTAVICACVLSAAPLAHATLTLFFQLLTPEACSVARSVIIVGSV